MSAAKLKWTDSLDIAIELVDSHPDVDPLKINFVDLRDWVMALPDFSDDPKHCGEKILEAIQQAWIDEVA
jgi:FeS assembly protein IscX